jgi:hypothetical protein
LGLNLFDQLADSLASTLWNVVPIVSVIAVFQLLVLRRPLAHWRRVLVGLGYVVVGLAIFLIGLELALFPLGETMALQLSDPAFMGASETGGDAQPLRWFDYYWTYLFAFAIGVSTTIAEPALIAVAIKASEVSGESIRPGTLRVAVALGVGTGVAVGTLRIVVGIPLPYVILPGYLLVVLQTFFAPKRIVPLAYDLGAVTTSTVTVPLVAALGLGLAGSVPDRDPLVDGFGLIAFASLFPMITVMGYAQLAEWKTGQQDRSRSPESSPAADANEANSLRSR